LALSAGAKRVPRSSGSATTATRATDLAVIVAAIDTRDEAVDASPDVDWIVHDRWAKQ
jgi:hypothetical protein